MDLHLNLNLNQQEAKNTLVRALQLRHKGVSSTKATNWSSNCLAVAGTANPSRLRRATRGSISAIYYVSPFRSTETERARPPVAVFSPSS